MTVRRGWRWWLTEASPVDERRMTDGEPLAFVGSALDALPAWAAAVDASRPVIDLRDGLTVKVGPERRVFDGAAPIVLVSRPEHVVLAFDVRHQFYLVRAVPLADRPGDALTLLQVAIDEHATDRPLHLAQLGRRLDDLRAHDWRGLAELRQAARPLAALLATGNITRAAARLGVTRQALQRFLARRT